MSLLLRHLAGSAVVMLVAGSAVGCGSGSGSARDTDGPELPPVKQCPSAPASTTTFPSGTSAQLPHPAYATDVEKEPVSTKGVDLLRFTTPMSLASAVQFVTKAYPGAGYQLVPGDEEKDEADIPFVKGEIHGKLRLSSSEACSTTWLLATVDNGSVDLGQVPGLGDHDSDGDSDSGDSGDSGDSDSGGS